MTTMRKTLFRCKLKDNGDWIYWDLIGRITTHTGKISKYTHKAAYGYSYYYHANQIWHMLDRETLGQFSGLTDNGGMRIFEGDIIHLDYIGKTRGVEGIATVIFENGKFGVKWGWHK